MYTHTLESPDFSHGEYVKLHLVEVLATLEVAVLVFMVQNLLKIKQLIFIWEHFIILINVIQMFVYIIFHQDS